VAGDGTAAFAPLASGPAADGFNALLPESTAGPSWLRLTLGRRDAGGLSLFFGAGLEPAPEAMGIEPLDGRGSTRVRSPNGSRGAAEGEAPPSLVLGPSTGGSGVSLLADEGAGRSGDSSLETAVVRTPSPPNVRLGVRSGLRYAPCGSSRGSSVRLTPTLALSAGALGALSGANWVASVDGGSLPPRWAWAIAMIPNTSTVASADIRKSSRFMGTFPQGTMTAGSSNGTPRVSTSGRVSTKIRRVWKGQFACRGHPSGQPTEV
jgi:hypothetical protein